jgi:hypothetical protein
MNGMPGIEEAGGDLRGPVDRLFFGRGTGNPELRTGLVSLRTFLLRRSGYGGTSRPGSEK